MARTRPVGKAKARQREQDRALRREARVERSATRLGILRRSLGWPLAGLGAILFALGWLGAIAGFQVLPFDSHHSVSQLGGGLLALIGVLWATS